MKAEEQRAAIAEACGWTPTPVTNTTGWRIGTTVMPDFLNDLNAMHEAEKVLTTEQYTAYWHHLFDVDRRYQRSITAPSVIYMIRAAAAQRAEAFLRTLNLWKES